MANSTILKKHYPPIKLGAPGEDISSKDLYAVIQRFKNLNQYRLLCVQEFLQPRQRVFLPLLPLLFHQNHPLLPGFISTETPAGIPDYKPGKNAVLAAKQFSKNYRYSHHALREFTIEGLFLMGSVGSIAFSKTSDMDIWLCYNPKLDAEQIDELQQKASAVEKWAESLNLEVHFFLINNEQFRNGENLPISSESSGQTQHYLLLEEFFRTAIYIAGKAPAWWIVPPEQEHHYGAYLSHLLENRFISPREVIDFGGLDAVPAEEFISATLWHIYKSLGSPYKSLLKLFLMESYASEYPHTQWLSLTLKTAIYQGEIDLDKLDPYLMFYEKVEEYLRLVASQKRLSLSRQCFYLKIMGSSPASLDAKSRATRAQTLQNIAQVWNWPNDMLDNFGKHRYWDIHKAIYENDVICDQLKQCLRMSLRFAGQYIARDYRNNQDLRLIGRKLHAALEQKPGKVEIITTRSNIHQHEDAFSIIETESAPPESRWRLYCGHIKAASSETVTIKTGGSLMEVLCWLVVNEQYRYQPKVHLTLTSQNISPAETQKILQQLQQFFNAKQNGDDSLENYTHPNRFQSSLLFINLGIDLPEGRHQGKIVMSHRADPLSYGDDKISFIHRTDRISISCWGEVTTAQYQGDDGFFHCLCDIMNHSQTPLTPDSLQLACYTPLRANSILLRVKAIFDQLLWFTTTSQSNWRYILPAQRSYCLFTQQHNQMTYWQLETNDMLLQELSNRQPKFGPVYFDEHVLDETFIPLIYSQIDSDTIQVFYHATEQQTTIHIIDEKGALFTRHYARTLPEHILNDYASFFQGLIYRKQLPARLDVRFFEIHKSQNGSNACQPVNVKALTKVPRLTVHVIAQTPSPIIFCNTEEFSSETSDNMFADAKNYILAIRNPREEYTFRINTIEASAAQLGLDQTSDIQTIHFLQYKQKIESRLMNARRR